MRVGLLPLPPLSLHYPLPTAHCPLSIIVTLPWLGS